MYETRNFLEYVMFQKAEAKYHLAIEFLGPINTSTLI